MSSCIYNYGLQDVTDLLYDSRSDQFNALVTCNIAHFRGVSTDAVTHYLTCLNGVTVHATVPQLDRC